MILRTELFWFFNLAIIPICICVISEPNVTKGPRRAELSGEGRNTVTSSSTATEEIESREYHGINKPRMPLVVHPGKAKPDSALMQTTTTNRPVYYQALLTTQSARILTAPPTTTPNPLERYKITSSFNADGCIMAVESPVNRPLTAPKTPGAPSSILTTTAAPRGSQSGLNNGRPSPPTTKGALPPTTTPATTTTAKPLKCTSANGNFPYGGDCKKFINCWQYRPYLQLCPEGKLFSTAFSTCEDAVKVNCQTASSTSSNNLDLTRSAFIPPPMEPLPTTPSSPGPPKLNCPTLNGLFPYGGDCSKFINCWRGRPHVQACAPGTLFSSITLNCDHAANVICQTSATTTTTTTTVAPTIIDPNKVQGMQISRSAFIPPPPIEPPSTTTASPGPPKLNCPKLNGLFPYVGDCNKFINCWKGRPHVQTCATGTLFNSATSECDHASKVICYGPSVAAESKPDVPFFDDSESARSSVVGSQSSEIPLAPDSGQRMRLRGGAGPWEGYLEVRGGKDKPWGHVCDAPGSWTLGEANVVCRHLGFIRGAQKSIQGLEFGPLTLDRVLVEKVECTGSEANVTGCKVHVGTNCAFMHDQVVGVRCNRDPQTLCAPDEYAHGNACYKLISQELSTRERARSLCEEQGGSLLHIFSQAENDFISELLSSVAPSVTKVHTDGMGIRALKKTLFMWEQNEIPFNYTKWWPEWERTLTGNPNVTGSAQCVILRNRFKYRSRCSSLPYFYWTLSECDTAAAALCKKKQRDIGCIIANGADYQGTANVSQTGQPCLSWADKRIRHVLGQSSRSAVATLDRNAARSTTGSTPDDGLHNYCRNPHDEAKPWCFISPMEMEFCDIPKCHIPGRGAYVEGQCKASQHRCKSGECIPNAWVCDGASDCDDESDEAHCFHYMDEFLKRENETLHRHDVEKWMQTNVETCARRCAEAKSFTCLSFNYYAKQQECVLSDSNRGMSGDMNSELGWTYYERKIYTVQCNDDNFFECPNGKCINQTSVCDVRNDCGDRSDEIVCQEQLDFQIRLAGTNKTNEGRVEVKVFGQWGAVCDDSFGLNDANVACRSLGFPLGASQALSHSTFGPGSPILMDDVQCRGNETSLADCSFSGWGVHNCNPEETAGVRCITSGTVCTESQWRCEKTEACIAIEFLCDTVDDCEDRSDENRTRCQSELKVRLADGPDSMSGRVEVRRNGVWGTICDDAFDTKDATVICRMMGHLGPAQAVKEGKFGPGQGPIWLDELGCSGAETTLLECSRLPWAKHNCKHAEDAGVRCSPQSTGGKVIAAEEPPSTGALPDLVRNGTLPASCGKRFRDDNPLDPLQAAVAKIVKGEPTKPGAHPWQVGVRVKATGRSDSVHWCGASIISEHFIITAAHCMEDFAKGLYVLRVGDYNTEEPDAEEEEFTVERMYFHEQFGQGAHLNNDIALIRVKTKDNRGIRFGSLVQPLCLPPPTTDYRPGMNCTISGWGSSGTPGAAYAIKLQSATVPLLPDDTCKAPYVYGPERIKDGMICAGFLEGGVDSCQGDSGGGLVCLVDGRPTLMGVTSWGFGCGRPNRPGVYTRLVKYLPWIYAKLTETNP